MEKSTNVRDQFWDVVKGIAIILVLVGHTIQFGFGEEYNNSYLYLNNPAFKLIYGFHMPLFMFVSGFFFYGSLKKRNVYEIAKKLLLSLVVPIVSFSIIRNALILDDVSLSTIPSFICHSLRGSIWVLWFLWAVIFSSIIVTVISKFGKDNFILYLLSVLFLYIIPDYVNTAEFKFIYPFFIFGYFTRKNEWMSVFDEYLLPIVSCSTILYVIMVISLLNHDVYVYYTKVSILTADDVCHQLYCDLMRVLIGICGVISSVGVIRLLNKKSFLHYIALPLAVLGTMSMGIYCFQDFLILVSSKCIPYFLGNHPLFFFLYIFCGSLLLTFLCSKTKVLRILLLGGR